MEYQINPQILTGMAAIPGKVCELLDEVDGDALRVLVFIFSNRSMPDVQEIQSKLHLTRSQVSSAIRYWQAKNILTAEPKTTSGMRKPDASCISTQELVEAKENNQNAAMLFEQAELLYTRPLKPSERRNLLYILETTDLPADVILMAVDYCIRIGKATARYILAVCENWSDCNIITHEQAEEQIRTLLEKNQIERMICSCFGIHNRSLTSNERKAIEKWTAEYKFPLNMIQIAYEKAADATGKLSFPYISKILSTWHKAGVDTPEKIDQMDHNKKTNKSSREKPSYNLAELAKKGLFIPESPK